jgi:hypothetical protein
MGRIMKGRRMYHPDIHSKQIMHEFQGRGDKAHSIKNWLTIPFCPRITIQA